MSRSKPIVIWLLACALAAIGIGLIVAGGAIVVVLASERAKVPDLPVAMAIALAFLGIGIGSLTLGWWIDRRPARPRPARGFEPRVPPDAAG